MNKARVGVIGAGWWATLAHLPSLQECEKAELTGLADPNLAKANVAAERYGVCRVYDDYRDLLASGEADGVVIAVPHASHYEVARDALDAGLHILLEKPMTLKAKDAWDLVERAQAASLHIVIGYESHFSRHSTGARDLVRNGKIGEIRFLSGLLGSMAESWYRGKTDDYLDVFDFPVEPPGATTYSDPAIAGGGQGQTQVTHALGLVLWTTGLRATAVSAFMEAFDLPVDLVDAVSFRLANGAVGSIGSTGTLRPNQPWQIEFRYYGSEGFVLHDLARGELAAHFNDGTSETFTPLEPEEMSPPMAPARCLVDLILGDGENLAPGDIGAAAVEVLEAAYLSAEGGRIVSVDEVMQRPAGPG